MKIVQFVLGIVLAIVAFVCAYFAWVRIGSLAGVLVFVVMINLAQWVMPSGD